ncbi:exported hypothetical protein [Burkholderia vietnamiensis]|nr:exported hypothetical protein [Burkholderia vietnamiensis]
MPASRRPYSVTLLCACAVTTPAAISAAATKAFFIISSIPCQKVNPDCTRCPLQRAPGKSEKRDNQGDLVQGRFGAARGQADGKPLSGPALPGGLAGSPCCVVKLNYISRTSFCYFGY